MKKVLLIYKVFCLMALVLFCALFAGCIDDRFEQDNYVDSVVEIGNLGMQTTEVITRATTDGYHAFDASVDLPADPVIIGITQKLPAGSNEIMINTATYDKDADPFQKGTKWKSNIRVKKYYDEASVMHNVFAVMTGREVADKITVELSDAGTPVMTISGIPAICSSNILVSSGSSLQGKGTNTLTKGYYSAHLGQDSNGSKNHLMNFIMDNMMCGLDLKFKIDERYSELRYIVLKSVQINSNVAKSATYKVTVNMTNSGCVVAGTEATGTGTTPTATYLIEKNTDNDIIIDSADPVLRGKGLKGMLLTTTATPFTKCYMVPSLANSTERLNGLSMTVIYDVYDKKGFCTRQNQTATNTLAGALLKDGNSLVMANNMIQLTINVKPTYLYNLSDNDLDNPGITISANYL